MSLALRPDNHKIPEGRFQDSTGRDTLGRSQIPTSSRDDSVWKVNRPKDKFQARSPLSTCEGVFCLVLVHCMISSPVPNISR